MLLCCCLGPVSLKEVWKTAIVVALHKKRSVYNPNEYRPVSLTSILCKVYEKIFRE